MGLKGPRGVELLQGESIELAASAARTATAGTNGTAFAVNGERLIYSILLDFTAKATDVTDTCDVFIDFLIGSTWVNAVHFTQALGNGTDASSEHVLLTPTGTAAPVTVTASAAAATVRQGVYGSQIRARWIIVDGGGDPASFTFSVTAYAL